VNNDQVSGEIQLTSQISLGPDEANFEGGRTASRPKSNNRFAEDDTAAQPPRI